jgi:hypothetical protein
MTSMRWQTDSKNYHKHFQTDMTRLRKKWDIDQPFDEAGFANGCLPQDDYDSVIAAELESNAIPFATMFSAGEQPVIRWDSDFEEFIDLRGERVAEMMADKSRCIFPWRVEAYLPSENRGHIDTPLYYSQGKMPSCMGHAADFAYRSSLLSAIALGAPLIYETTNPIVCWYLSKGRSVRGGQSVAAMAEYANKTGHFLTADVGNANTSVPGNYSAGNENAKKHQSAIVFLPGSGETLVQNVICCCRAGLGVALGNSLAVNGVTVKDGIRLATLGGKWKHATSFCAWMRRGGQDYCFLANSHGKRYKGGSFGEPEDGVWMDTRLMRPFLDASSGYGRPYAVLAESRSIERKSVKVDLRVPFPQGWERT